MPVGALKYLPEFVFVIHKLMLVFAAVLLEAFLTASEPLPAEYVGQHADGGFRQLGRRLK